MDRMDTIEYCRILHNQGVISSSEMALLEGLNAGFFNLSRRLEMLDPGDLDRAQRGRIRSDLTDVLERVRAVDVDGFKSRVDEMERYLLQQIDLLWEDDLRDRATQLTDHNRLPPIRLGDPLRLVFHGRELAGTLLNVHDEVICWEDAFTGATPEERVVTLIVKIDPRSLDDATD